jgi:hypothetical protein
MLVLLLRPPPLLWAMIHASVQASSKEHVEDVILIVLLILLIVPLLVLHWHILFRTALVIDRSLLRVTQTRIGLCDLFECLFSFGIAILIRVYFEGSLLIGLLDVLFLATALGESQNLIVVLLLENELAALKLHQTQFRQ